MKKLFILILSVLLLVGCTKEKPVEQVNTNSENTFGYSETENVLFNEFLDKEFKDEMEADYLNNHYTLNDSSAMGITKPEAKLDPYDFTLESYADFVEDAQISLEELNSFDVNTLTEKQYYDYLDYKNNLENYMELNKYPLFDQYFLPSTGLHENLITTFMEFNFRHVEEYEDYLNLLEDVPEYIEAALELTRYQAENGYFMTDGAVDETIKSIDSFTSKTEDNELITSFNESVDDNDKLSDDLKEEYKKRNKDLILNYFIPAYKDIRKELISLKGSRSIDGGLALYENGAEYYSLYVKNKTGSDLSIQELFDMCDEYLVKLIKDYIAAYQKDPDAFDEISYEVSQLEEFETEDILEFVKENMSKDFPQGPNVNYKISYLDETTANPNVLAYYLIPPIDLISENIIRVNPKTGEDKLGLYSTVSHEGFPGHLYQITYDFNTKPHPIRSNISNTAYTEGWAMYTELIAIDYLDVSDAEKLVYKLDIRFGYVLSAALDLYVNGLGNDFETTKEWLLNYIDPIYVEDVYNGAIDDPGIIVPYGVGLAYYENLRDKAENELGDKFDAVKYHEAILKNSDRPLYLLESDIEKFIGSNK